MTLLSTAEADAAAWIDHVHHAALWLIGAAVELQKTVASLEASNPLVNQAVQLASTYAAARGVPVPALEDAAAQILALAQKIAAPPAAS